MAEEGLQGMSELDVLEDAGVAFNPTEQHLDLSHDEKRRTTALMMAIQAYRDFIIKEADYLHEAADSARRDEGPKLKPATEDGILTMAMKFDAFIDGRFQLGGDANVGRGTQSETSADATLAE